MATIFCSLLCLLKQKWHLDLLWVADVRHGAVEGDSVTDVDVEAILAIGLIHPISIGHGEGLPLLPITCSKHTVID